jgi:cytidine deaminase
VKKKRREAAPPADLAEMVRLARAARHRALAPYSGFKVGAALLAESGEIVTGCNVESATYGLTMCAERVAIFKAISEGVHRFLAVAVVADSSRVSAPCGACRQVLWELGGDLWVRLADLKGKSRTLRLSELLPLPFDRRNL